MLWKRLIAFLEKNFSIQQQKIIINEGNKSKDQKQQDRPQRYTHYNSKSSVKSSSSNDLKCHICGKEDHVPTAGPGGIKLIQYFTCEQFVEMTPADRFQLLKRKGLCFQCLYPGAKITDTKHSEGRCQRDYTCKHPSHDKFPTKKHVLVCAEHKDVEENKTIFELCKCKCILKPKHIQLPGFSREIKLSFHLDQLTTPQIQQQPSANATSNSFVQETATFQMQTIKINNNRYSIFFDSGCGDLVSSYNAIRSLTSNATQEHARPITIGGVGGVISVSQHRIYKVNLPLYDESHATMLGVCLDNITSKFLLYPVQGKVLNGITKAYKYAGGDPTTLPKIPKSVGGETDFMIDIKYLRYYPKMIFQLPSGLTIYESVFENANGVRGV